MILYRITSKPHIRDLSGTGAMLFGGRWNPKGVRMFYTSESLSLAMLETVANLSGEHLNKNFHQVRLEMPDNLPLYQPTLPSDWNVYPHGAGTVNAGAQFIQESHFCMKVPSAIIPSEYNFLLNPMHEFFDEIKYLDSNPILIDRRLLTT